jgi:hypothetical protein
MVMRSRLGPPPSDDIRWWQNPVVTEILAQPVARVPQLYYSGLLLAKLRWADAARAGPARSGRRKARFAGR